MAKKFRVSQDGVIFGHFYAHDAEKAIQKAYQRVGQYYSFDFSKSFDIKHGTQEYATFGKAE